MGETVKHSPGSWFVSENCVKSEGRCVARLDWDIRDEVDDANARLIAASPTMLEALRQCQRALAMMIAPDVIKQTTVLNAFEQATAAELAAREAITLVDEAQSPKQGANHAPEL